MVAKKILLIVLVVLSVPSGVMARGRNVSRTLITPNAQRQAIRAMPIHHRPDRPGHFYGNTVRRRARNGR